MTGKNATRLVGWHPRADLVEWLEAEIERRGGGRGVQSGILDEALEEYRDNAEYARMVSARTANREIRSALNATEGEQR